MRNSKIWLLILLFYLPGSFVMGQSSHVTKQEEIPDVNQHIEAVAELNRKLSWEFIQEYPDSALRLAETLSNLARNINDESMLARAFLIKGQAKGQIDHQFVYNPAEAIVDLLKSYEIYQTVTKDENYNQLLHLIGHSYLKRSNYLEATKYYTKLLDICEHGEYKSYYAECLNGIGEIYRLQNREKEALSYYKRVLEVSKDQEDLLMYSIGLTNIGLIHFIQKDFTSAEEYFQKHLEINKQLGRNLGVIYGLANLGDIAGERGDYQTARAYYQQSLDVLDLSVMHSHQVRTLNKLGKLHLKFGKVHEALRTCVMTLRMSQELNIIQRELEACDCLYKANKTLGNYEEALKYMEMIAVLNDSLLNEKTVAKMEQFEFERQLYEDSLINNEQKLRTQLTYQNKLRVKNKTRNVLIVSALFLVILVLSLWNRNNFVRKSNRLLSAEKDRSENLLLNILPQEIAEELKQTGESIARNFDNASILFTDFKSFTNIAENLEAADVVKEINVCFKEFDEICETNAVEKIKTIGDAYMAAGGLPIPNEYSVRNTVLAGLQMADFIKQRKMEMQATGGTPFEMRIGIHSGPVTAGIVGVKKFQYDVWGDTVNTASRLESACEVGKVNISSSTYERIKDEPIFKFEDRGEIEVKGKGKLRMYYVTWAD